MKLGSIYIGVRAKTDQYKRDLANAKTMTDKAAIVMQHKINSITFAQVGVAALAFGAIMTKVGLDGFRAMEKMKLSTASLASTITSFAKDADKDLAGTYKQAYGYSEQLVLKMEELNAQTVATGENLTAMVETMAQGGILLDLNNEKQLKGFLAIANALALVTQGQDQDIQFRQEIRGLIDGEVKSTNALSRILSQKVGGNLKENVKLWKEQGTLIESAGALLSGFQEGAKDLENTWEAVGTTLSTMYNKTLRGLMAPVYEDIIQMGKQITLNVLDQNSTLNKNAVLLRTVVYKGWQDIKNITESVIDIVAAFETPLKVIGGTIGVILDGWGQIFAILPAITNRIKLMVQAVFDSVKMVGNLGAALWHVASGEFKNAATAWKAAKKDWAESGRKTAAAFSSGFGSELLDRIEKYNKDLTTIVKPPVLPPELKTPAGKPIDTEKVLKDLQALNRKKYAMDIALAELIKDDTWLIRQKGFDAAIKQHESTQTQITQIEYDIRKDFNEQYAELGKTRFDLEREQIERRVEIWREAGIEENKISKMVSDKNIQIAKAEQMAKLDVYQNIAGGIAGTFQAIAQAGGKQSKKAFMVYKAFAMVEAAISGHKAILQALGSAPPPYNFVLAGIAGAAAAIQVGMIASAQPPSYDQGGISNARGIYQTGDIAEAHIPIPSGGKIPVEVNNNDEKAPTVVNIFNTVDPGVLDAWSASSRGQNAIFNTIGSQPQRLRRLVR